MPDPSGVLKHTVTCPAARSRLKGIRDTRHYLCLLSMSVIHNFKTDLIEKLVISSTDFPSHFQLVFFCLLEGLLWEDFLAEYGTQQLQISPLSFSDNPVTVAVLTALHVSNMVWFQ